MIYFATAIFIYILHVLLKLNVEMCMLLGIYALVVIPHFEKRYKQMQSCKRRFYDVSQYLDTILYAFVKEEKVDLAVRDVYHSLPEGMMKSLVEKAYDYMTMTYDEVEVLEEALAMITQEYPCKRIQDVHKFMTHVEYYGGEIERPVSLLLADKARWEKRIKEEIAGRTKQFVDVLLSVLASLVICGAIIYLPIMDIDISQKLPLQIIALGVIVIDSWIVFGAFKFLAVDWIGLKLQEEESVVQKMQEYENYDEDKQKRISKGLGVVGIGVTILLVFFGNKWITAIMLLMTLLFFNQHIVGKKLMEKTLLREIKYAFPNWLLDLVLLLQSENVQMALQKSNEFVPGVLRQELSRLNEQLEMEPESAKPYYEFLKGFAIPEVHSAMGILYSISIGNSGNADKQISELVDKNLELLDITEKDMLKRQAGGLQILFLLPVLTASFKLVADMVLLMMEFLKISAM